MEVLPRENVIKYGLFSGYDFVTEMPKTESMMRSLYRHRSNAQGNAKEPEHRENIVFDNDTLTMIDGSSFLLANDGNEDRIIVFCGSKGKESLKCFSHFFMDGTFKSTSKQFSQIYTIHADFGSSNDETNICPIVFALLPNKKKQTYTRLFRLLLQAVPEWRPENINVDFETAVISSLQEVFPTTKIHGCHFHMTKCLWRKVQDLGLSVEYRGNSEISLHVRMCAALAFLKPEDVLDGWVEIHSQAPESSKLSQFFDYFVENWLDNQDIPIEMWNCHQARHRTTNAVEGWNNRLNNLVGRPHPKLKEVVKVLKTEAEKTNCAFLKAELNMEGKKRRRKYVKLDGRIEKIQKKFENDKKMKSFLKAVAYSQKME